MRALCLSCLLILGLVLLGASPALAVVGEIQVTEAGEPVPGASVTITFEDGTPVAKGESDDRGAFGFVLADQYMDLTLIVTVEKEGAVTKTNVSLAKDATKTTVAGETRYVVRTKLRLD